jgi:hypothetical protein
MERPAAQLWRAIRQHPPHLRDERRGRGAHRLEIDPVPVRRLAAYAHAEVVGGQHDKSLGGQVFGEAVAGMPRYPHVPVRARIGASRPADQDGWRCLVLAFWEMDG